MRQAATVATAVLPPQGRTIVISDVHGNRDLLDRLLAQVAYRPGQDALVLNGDMLLKGGQNLDTISRVMELARQPGVHVLCGNCDDIREIIDNNYPSPGMDRFLHQASFCTEVYRKLGMEDWSSRPSGELLAVLERELAPALSFFHGLPTILDTPHFRFVHGGIYDGRQTGLEELDSFSCRKCDDFQSKGYVFDKYLVVGHWPVCLYSDGHPNFLPVINRRQRILSIDGGCQVKEEGQLNALIIQDDDPLRLAVAAVDRLPRVRALGSQAASDHSFYIRWLDDQVEALVPGDEFTRVRHLRTGYEMEVRTQALWKDGDGLLRVSDSTDYCLPVQPGDVLSVIAATARGVYAKLHGSAGWYAGAWEPMEE